MRGRKRPADERARAVGIAVLAGSSEASRQTGVPAQTINVWLHSDEFSELRERNKEEVAAEWWAGIQAYQRAIMRDIDSASLRDKVGAFAIMFEKLANVRGEATVRSEVTHFRDYNDHERRDLSAALDALLEGTAGDRAQADSAEVRQ